MPTLEDDRSATAPPLLIPADVGAYVAPAAPLGGISNPEGVSEEGEVMSDDAASEEAESVETAKRTAWHRTASPWW